MNGFPVAMFFGMPGFIELCILLGLLGLCVSAGLVVTFMVMAGRMGAQSGDSGNPNLYPCPDCGHSISKSALVCPNCGKPLT